jgi:hypothetical protein
MYAIKEVEIILFWIMKPDHNHVIHIMVPALGLVGCPAVCQVLDVLHEEVDSLCFGKKMGQ